ncbi:MarC family protein [Sphingomonas sp. GlSt437]|uniref:MarC family protein n=1 Tax=Sphingomonas sp. GlSt437 TaxID=3389970 RepID=UPI003A8C3355
MLELFVSSLITFFVVIDPPGCAPIYAGLTAGAPRHLARAMAVRAVLIAGGILVVFALFGQDILSAIGASLDSFRIAGGILLFVIATEMVLEKRTQRREDRAQKLSEAHVEDVSVFPMAMPMIAGPGSIASIMLLMSKGHGIERTVVILTALATILALTMAALILAGPIMKVLGDKIEAVVTRLLGVLLAALAAQFVIDGIKGSFFPA